MKKLFAVLVALFAALPLPSTAQLREGTPEEKAADAQAFAAVAEALAQRFTDVQSVVVVRRGRVAYEFYRDGQPERLRDQQSVTKSGLGALVGIALQQGAVKSLDEPVLSLMPEWAPLNTDPRAAAITLRHLLALTPGFQADDPDGIRAPLTPAAAWARPLRAAPGERFAYDNSVPMLAAAVLQKATGMSMEAYALQHLVQPLDMAPPTYRHGLASLRTVDAAKLGQLMLQQGAWGGRRLLPAEFAGAATRAASAGGAPVGLPYGLAWWISPSGESYFASGFGGQLVWVHPPLDLVVAVNSTVSLDSARRGHALRLALDMIFPAAAAGR